MINRDLVCLIVCVYMCVSAVWCFSIYVSMCVFFICVCVCVWLSDVRRRVGGEEVSFSSVLWL